MRNCSFERNRMSNGAIGAILPPPMID